MPVNSEKEHSGNQSECKGHLVTAFEIEHKDVNRMDSDVAGHEQERYDETSRLIKIAINKNEWSTITSDVPGHTTLQHSCQTSL